MAVATKTDSSTGVSTLYSRTVGGCVPRGVSIHNTDANALYVLIGPGTVSSSLFTVSIAQNAYFETPPWYNGESITGTWAADGSGSAFVTAY